MQTPLAGTYLRNFVLGISMSMYLRAIVDLVCPHSELFSFSFLGMGWAVCPLARPSNGLILVTCIPLYGSGRPEGSLINGSCRRNIDLYTQSLLFTFSFRSWTRTVNQLNVIVGLLCVVSATL